MASYRPVHLSNRISYIDGLRGVAVGMVLLYHAWLHHVPLAHPSSASGPASTLLALYNFFVARGNEGVSLFLVLSGFCLSYPLWKRRHSGATQWFRPSDFFARRCHRILPPYYVALFLFVFISYVFAWFRWHELGVIGQPPSALNLWTHILLIHNLTPFIWTINTPFWSLGLEWQWYWAFPLMFLLCLRSQRVALILCLGLALLWHVGTHDLWSIGALPARLFEFCCGIIAARSIVEQRIPSRVLILPALALLPCLMILQTGSIPHTYAVRHLLEWAIQPLYGISFAALILLGSYNSAANALLSWRPLVGLGVASYSVYLVHEPIVEAVDELAPLPLRHSALVMIVAALCGLAIGVFFHLIVERPFMSRTTYNRIAPLLAPLFGWTDKVWTWIGSEAGIPVVPQNTETATTR